MNGEAGFTSTLEMLRDKLDVATSMSGRPTIADIDRDIIGSVSLPLGMFLRQQNTFRY